MGHIEQMKTTLELPDQLLRRAKAHAAERGQTMTALVKAAIEAKLDADQKAATEKPWMRFAGINSDTKESGRIMDVVDEYCGQVNPEDWQ